MAPDTWWELLLTRHKTQQKERETNWNLARNPRTKFQADCALVFGGCRHLLSGVSFNDIMTSFALETLMSTPSVRSVGARENDIKHSRSYRNQSCNAKRKANKEHTHEHISGNQFSEDKWMMLITIYVLFVQWKRLTDAYPEIKPWGDYVFICEDFMKVNENVYSI